MFGEAVTLRPGNFRFVYFSSGGRDIYAYSDVVTIRSGIFINTKRAGHNECLGLEPCHKDQYLMHLKLQKIGSSTEKMRKTFCCESENI